MIVLQERKEAKDGQLYSVKSNLSKTFNYLIMQLWTFITVNNPMKPMFNHDNYTIYTNYCLLSLFSSRIGDLVCIYVNNKFCYRTFFFLLFIHMKHVLCCVGKKGMHNDKGSPAPTPTNRLVLMNIQFHALTFIQTILKCVYLGSIMRKRTIDLSCSGA